MLIKITTHFFQYAFLGMLFFSHSFSQSPVITDNNLDKAGAYFIKALEVKSKGQKDSAFFYYKLASFYDSKSLSLKKEILKLSLDLKQYREALLQARELVDSKESFEENTWQLIALAYFNRTLTDSSIYFFKKSLDINPENPQVLWYLASAYEKISDYKSMKDTYLKLIRLEDYPEELVKIHMTILSQSAEDSVHLNEFLEEIWEKKRNISAGLWKVEKFHKLKQYDSASIIIDTLYNLDSTQSQILAFKILNMERLNKNDSLLFYVSKLYKQDTTHINILRALAKIELEKNLLDSAREHFDLIILNNKSDATDYLYAITLNSYTQKFKQKALKMSLKARNLFPTQISIQKQYVQTLSKNSMFDQAILTLDTLQILFPDHFWQQERLQLYFTSIQELSLNTRIKQSKISELREKSKIVFQQLYSQNPNLPQNAFYGLQLASLEKDTIKGQFFYKSLIEENKFDHRTMNYWGYTLVDNDLNLEYGLELINNALKIKPTEAAYLDSKSWYYYKVNQLDSAWALLQKIPESQKEDPEFDLHAALILEKMKQPSKAKLYWNRLKLSYPFHPLIPKPKNKK